jgi:hypothetical protein
MYRQSLRSLTRLSLQVGGTSTKNLASGCKTPNRGECFNDGAVFTHPTLARFRMDALKIAVLRRVFSFALVLLATTLTSFCRADDCVPCSQCGHGHFFDGSTLCRWYRTAHGPNSNWRPLREFYVPRPADPCKYGGYGRCCYNDGCEGDGTYLAGNGAEYEGENLMGYDESSEIPVGLERLGKIPNDPGIAGGAGVGAAQPGR